jgi:hypothetical protein
MFDSGLRFLLAPSRRSSTKLMNDRAGDWPRGVVAEAAVDVSFEAVKRRISA